MARDEIDPMIAAHRSGTPKDSYVESILPVLEANQARLVAGDYALNDQVWLEPTPGHTQGPCHCPPALQRP